MASHDTRTPLEVTLADTVNLVPGIIAESVMFGVLSLVAVFSIFTVMKQSNGSSRSRVFMLGVIIAMYTMSAVHWAMNIYTIMREIRNPQAWAALPVQDIYGWSVVTTVALFFNFWLSDIIVMWRACVIWAWNRHVTIPCCFFIASPLILAIIDVSISRPGPTVNSYQPHASGLVALLISLLSNLYATSLIGYKACLYRKNIQAYIEAGTTSSVQNILVLLVESGFLYCFIWALFIVSRLFTNGTFEHDAHLIASIVPPLVGLYPAIIIVLVSLQKTHCNRNFTYGSSVASTVGDRVRATGVGNNNTQAISTMSLPRVSVQRQLTRLSEGSISTNHDSSKTQTDSDITSGDRLTCSISPVFKDTFHEV